MGALTLLLSLGSAFVMNMMGENRQAESFILTLRARLAAQAGLARAIAELRKEAIETFPAYGAIAASGITGDLSTNEQYSVTVADMASRIHLNDSNSKVPSMLQSFSGIGSETADKMHQASHGTRYLPHSRYVTKKQLKQIPGVEDVKYGRLKDFVTVSAYQDTNTTQFTQIRRRSPININTAQLPVLEAVLRPFLGDQATAVANAIISRRAGNPFSSWEEYDAWVATIPGLSNAQERNLRDNMNPNRRHAWVQNNANTKADKYATEFCFHSGGMYEIVSRGRVPDGMGNSRSDIAITATARIYEIYNMTTKEQFRGEDINSNWAPDGGEDVNGNGLLERPEYLNVTWADSCPVNSQDETPLGYTDKYDTVNDALKLGFWDDFEDPSFSKSIWINKATKPGSDYEIENSDTRNNVGERDNDFELHHTSTVPPANTPEYWNSRFGAMELTHPGSKHPWLSGFREAWFFSNAYIRVDAIEDTITLAASNPLAGHDDVARLDFRAIGDVNAQVFARYPGIHYFLVRENDYRPSSVYQEYPLTEDGWKADSDNNPFDKASENERGGTPVVLEDDYSTLPRPLTVGELVEDRPGEWKEWRLKCEDRVTFTLGTEPQGRDGHGQVRRSIYVLGGTGINRYKYYPRRTYRLYTINRILFHGYLPGVYLHLTQEAPGGAIVENVFPEDGVDGSFYTVGDRLPPGPHTKVPYFFGSEINTRINVAGTIRLKNNSSFPSWDNVRVITPVGEFQSPVIDAGTDNVYWGTISWTATVPRSARADRERISFEPKSFVDFPTASSHTLGSWGGVYIRAQNSQGGSGESELFDGNRVASGQELWQSKGRLKASGDRIVGDYEGSWVWGVGTIRPTEARHGQRFLRFKTWLTSERYARNAPDSDSVLDDARFLRETPVLEDITVTYVTPTRIMGYREGG